MEQSLKIISHSADSCQELNSLERNYFQLHQCRDLTKLTHTITKKIEQQLATIFNLISLSQFETFPKFMDTTIFAFGRDTIKKPTQ